MLVGPLDGQVRVLVVLHLLVLLPRPDLGDAVFVLNGLVAYCPRARVPTLGVVLAVKEPVPVVAVHIALAVSVIGPAGVVLR